MMMRGAIVLIVAGTIAVGMVTAPGAPRVEAQASRCEIDGVERIVAVGDVHGAYDRLVEILTTTGVLDAKLRWSGGKTHLVQLGDVVDRGHDSRKALDLLKRLQDEARRAGGAVHLLLGNHEIMRMLGDLRYVTPGEYQAFTSGRSERVRRSFVDEQPKAVQAQLLKDTPLGQIEMRVAFGHDGEYGEWLRKLNVVMKINGILFLHGGLSPALSGMTCDAINTTVQRELTADLDKTRAAPLETLSASEEGPLWYRGLAQEPDEFAPKVDEILTRQNARAIVIGHTLVPEGRIRARFGRKVIQIDTGMQPAYVETGRASALEIQGDTFTAVYGDRRDPIVP